MTIETKSAKNGTKMYYVDGKRTSRDNAIEAATLNRVNPFTIKYVAYDTKIGDLANQVITTENLKIRVIPEAHKYDMVFGVFVRGKRIACTCGRKTDAETVRLAKKAITERVDAIVEAYITGEDGVQLAGAMVSVISNGAFPDEYAISEEAMNVAVEAEEAQAAKAEREEILSLPLVTEEAMEEAYLGEFMNAYDAETATKKEAFYQALTEALLLKFTLIKLEEAMLETVVSEEAMEIAINAEIEAASEAKAAVEAANNTAEEQEFKFEIGKTYYAGTWAGEWSENVTVIVKTLKIIKRTAKTLTAIDENGAQVTKKITLGYHGTTERVGVEGSDDFTAYSVNLYAKNEYTDKIAAVPTHSYNAWLVAITNTEDEPETAEFDANEEIINCTNDITISDAAYRQMIDTEINNAEHAAGNYVLTINGEDVYFENHKIVRIDAKSKYGLNMRIVNGRKQFRRYNYVIARETVAKFYMNSERAAEQEKKFREFFIKDDAAKKGFFAVKVYAKLADEQLHIYANYFDTFKEAHDFVASVKEFIGDVQCEIYIQRDKQCGKIYYKRDENGNETYDLPDTDFFKGTPAAEIQARIDELKKAHADNAQYKDNPDVGGYVWSELCVANADIEKTIEYYEFILHENALVTTAEIDGSEEDDDTNEAFNLLPSVEELNDVDTTQTKDEIKAAAEQMGLMQLNRKIADLEEQLIDNRLAATAVLNEIIDDTTFAEQKEIERRYFKHAAISDAIIDEKAIYNAAKSTRLSQIAAIKKLMSKSEPATVEEVKTSDAQHQNEFADELARRKAEQIAALDAVEQARLALYKAQKAYDKASAAYEKFGADKAKEISQRRLPPAGISTKIAVVTQDGRILDKPDLKKLRIDFLPDDPSFEINIGWDCLGNYKSPAQVETVLNMLKAAVGRGDEDFNFPTVDDAERLISS